MFLQLIFSKQDYLSVSILACSRNPSFLRATWKWGENTQTKQGVNCKLELGTLKFCWSAVRHIPWQGYCFLFLHGPPTMTWHDLQCYTRMRWNKLMGWAMLSHKTRTKETQEYKFVGLALLWCTVCFHNLSWKAYDYFSPITSLPVCRAFWKGLTEKILLNKFNLWDNTVLTDNPFSYCQF